MADKREFLFSFLGKETVSKASKKAGDGIEDLGDKMSETERDAKKLDEQIGDVEKSLKGLAAQYARTGDDTFVKQIRSQERELRKLNKVKVHLGDMIDPAEATKAGVNIAARMGPVIISNLPKALASGGGIGAAIAGPIVAEVATVLGAAVGGAITGGVGIGGVIGGVTIASKHAAVKSAAEAMGNEFENRLQKAAVSFVPATISGISVIRNKLAQTGGDLEAIFAKASRFVVPLAEGAGTGIQEVIVGARALVDVAGPAIDAISEGLAEIGTSARDGMEALTDNSESGARALALVFEVIEFGVRSVFGLINGLAELYEVMEFGNGVLEWLTRANDKAGNSSDNLSGSLSGLVKGFDETSTEAEDAARSVQEYADALDEIVDQNLSAAEANLRYRDSLKDAKEAADGKKRVSMEEEEQLVRLARSSNTLTDSLEEQGASTQELSARNKQARDDFIATAIQMGYSREKAKALADQYLKIPRKIDSTITANTAQAARNLRDIIELAAQIKSKRVTITTFNNQVVTRSEGRNVGIGDGIGGRAVGGPVTAGTPYIVGEKRAEVFVPDQNGTIVPSVDEFNRRSAAATNYAMAAHPGMQGGGTARHEITIRWPDGRVAGQLVIDGFRSDSRGTLGALQGALRGTPGVKLRTS